MKNSDSDAGVYLVCYQTKTIRLQPNQHITIGREKYNDVVLNDLLVSRQHAEISWKKDQFVIKDLKSRNGTYVNNKQITTKGLTEGDVIKIGGYEFTLRTATHMDVEQFLLREKVRMSTQQTLTGSDLGLRFSDKGFSGSLAALSMEEIVQTLSQCLKTGVLTIKKPKEVEHSGFLYFENGEIVHGEMDGLDGLDAVLHIINLNEGQFEFQNDIAPLSHTVEQSTISILLEAARKKDESHRRQTQS